MEKKERKGFTFKGIIDKIYTGYKWEGVLKMKQILLVCSAGMSTSLLVTKMEQAAEKVGDEVEIFALPMSDGINRLSTVDCVLLGPQVRFNLGKIKEEAAKVNPGLPVDVIDMKVSQTNEVYKEICEILNHEHGVNHITIQFEHNLCEDKKIIKDEA